jgi:hypothetical protein
LSLVARIVLVLVCSALPVVAAAQSGSLLRSTYRPGDFRLVYAGKAAPIVISEDDFKVVQIAAGDLAADVLRVGLVKPEIRNDVAGLSGSAVIVGTLGRSRLIDSLVKAGKLNVSDLKDKWESFVITTVSQPLPGLSSALVIAGSDRRGTAFGIYELSQAIGVSPWNWWADVSPVKRQNLVIASGLRRFGPPSVKYRGIFINDEDWGLQPWAAKTFEPEVGDIGPKTYAKIFELMLRLKANTVWPAMHACTRPFNSIPENRKTADNYAIVMGSSHAEPMLRNNVGEWKAKPEEFDYTKNPQGVFDYWNERIATNGRFESIYTLGMRGIHDSPIQGPKTQPERIALLEKIFELQRGMIAKHVDPRVEQVPQIFCPYKEVLADYRAGLKVPDDVTIVFPDDNFGYIRYFPNAEEQKRPGGFGVYYHISYLGRPISYLWLNSTPPALIWEEMSKAYDHGMRQLWILNVGDIKPAEIGIEFFMQLAWDAKRWRHDNLEDFLVEWATREFGASDAREIASVMREYYELGFARKPEHLQWYLPRTQPEKSSITAVDYGDESTRRLDAYENLLRRAKELYKRDGSAAFFELVIYPVQGATLANRRFLLLERSELYARQGRASAIQLATEAEKAGVELESITRYYNERLVGGKWRHLISLEMGPGQWPSMRSTPPQVSSLVRELRPVNRAELGVAVEGNADSLEVPAINSLTREQRFVDIFNEGTIDTTWTAKSNVEWLKLSQTSGKLGVDSRVWLSVDWRKIPRESSFMGEVQINSPVGRRTVRVPVRNVPWQGNARFAESNGVVAFEAESFSAKRDVAGVGWKTLPGLGRIGGSVFIAPTTAPSVAAGTPSPSLSYDLQLISSGEVKVIVYLVPTQPLSTNRGLRLAVGLDDATPQVMTVGAGVEVSSTEWSFNVLNATITGTTTLNVSAPGQHTFKLYMIDAGVVVDRVVLDFGGRKSSYLGPPETRLKI